jgi:type I restriction enzyme M protein
MIIKVEGGRTETLVFSSFPKVCDLLIMNENDNFVLTPGRYVGIPDEVEDGVSFEEKMSELTMALGEQMREGQLLDEEIKKQLLKVGFIVSDELVDF